MKNRTSGYLFNFQQSQHRLSARFAAAVIFLGLVLLPLFATTTAQAGQLGTVPGEKLLFNVHWMGVPGGRAVMQTKSASPGSFELESTVETTGLASWFHSLHDKLHSWGEYGDNGKMRTSRFFRDQKKRGQVRQVTHEFDRKKGVITRLAKDEKTLLIEIDSDVVNDPLALFYSLRALPELQPGANMQLMTVSVKLYPVTVDIGQPTKKFTPLGSFHVIPVKLSVPSNEGLFKQKEALTIWLTTDDRRLPVRVETRLAIGSVAAELVEYDDGRGGHQGLTD